MTHDFLNISGKQFLVFGVANRKSVAFHIGRVLTEAGANVVYVVRSPERKESVQKLLGDVPIYVCDVEHEEQITRLRREIGERNETYHGLVHSIAFADYGSVTSADYRPGTSAEHQPGPQPFHETGKAAFLRSVDVSCYSLIALSNAFKDLLDRDGSVVTISISTTRMASENYGFMAPIKAALDSSLAFLAKSFSNFSRIRFNAVAPGLLKTSASAGIPGYVDAYLYAEQATLRKQAVQTEEVANAAAFLLSPRSSGMNAQHLVIDAGMSVNYFDRELVRRAMRSDDK
jgi:enoyl-[acyl-carrier protein] reductase I